MTAPLFSSASFAAGHGKQYEAVLKTGSKEEFEADTDSALENGLPVAAGVHRG